MKKNEKLKNGFTLSELLAVICVMAVIITIAVPTYLAITDRIKNNIYQSKIANIKAKASAYAEDTKETIFDVNTLIVNGYLSADNEHGEFLNPVNNRNMSCDVINAVYNSNQYDIYLSQSDECLSKEDLEEKYGFVHLKLFKDEALTEEVNYFDNTNWLNESPLYVSYVFDEKYDSYKDYVKDVVWTGEQSISCSIDNLEACKYYKVETSSLKDLTVHFEIHIEKNSMNYANKLNKRILIDKQKPVIYENTLELDNDLLTKDNRKVTIKTDDGNGSRVKEYTISSNGTCQDKEYSSINGDIITAYLTNGKYYFCVKDYVGNISDAFAFQVKNVDTSSPEITKIRESGTTYANSSYYKDLNIIVNTSDDNKVEEVQYCLTTSKNSCNPDLKADVDNNGTATISISDSDKEQKICAKAVDKAGNQSDVSCYGYFWKKGNIKVFDACQMCNSQNGYCNYENGVYIKYGKYLFTLYRNDIVTNSCYGFTNAGTMPLINTFCCDQGVCHSEFVYSESVGIYKSLKAYYNQLPETRINYLNQVDYLFGSVSSNSFSIGVNPVKNNGSDRHEIKTFSLDTFPTTVNQGYTYGLPSEFLLDVTCQVGDISYSRIEGDNFEVNKSYEVVCRRKIEEPADVKEDDTVIDEDNNDGNLEEEPTEPVPSEPKYEEIRRTFKVVSNPDLVGGNVGSAGVTSLGTGYIAWKSNPVRQKVTYGLLDIMEYQMIRNKFYARDMQTLVSTVVDAVVYSKDNSGNWNLSFGHDGVNSDISAIYVTNAGYYAVTPMDYGARNAVMTVPFNKNVSIIRGAGTKSDPFVIG